jgi:hypothetical protein
MSNSLRLMYRPCTKSYLNILIITNGSVLQSSKKKGEDSMRRKKHSLPAAGFNLHGKGQVV